MSVAIGTQFGDAILITGDEPTTVFGKDGDDTVFGGDFGDIIFGEGGSDILIGGDGNDAIFGGSHDPSKAGRDYLFGGKGNDLLSGGDGEDVLSGGLGADIFQSRLNEGGEGFMDTVVDFTVGEDSIAIQGGTADMVVAYNNETGIVTVDGQNFMQLDAGLDMETVDYFIV